MIDWISVELPDPVGIPVNAGEIIRVRRDGEVEWSTPARLQVEGSWSSSMTFRAIGRSDCAPYSCADWNGHGTGQAGLVVSGNPAKFLTGHNLFGSDDLTRLLDGTIAKARNAIWPDLFEQPSIDYGQGRISRIDLTASWRLDRALDVVPYLRSMEETIWCPHRGRGVFDAGGSTLYYGRTAKGKRAKDWALKLYWKGAEVTAHPLPEPAYQVPGLIDDLARTIRVELTLRTAELKRLGMRRVCDWTPAKVREIWELYVAKLDFGNNSVTLDTADAAASKMKPRHAHALAAWKAGNDLRSGMTPESFYRLRRELKAIAQVDIALAVPKSNVVPLRRVIVAHAPSVPLWASQLTQALSRVA